MPPPKTSIILKILFRLLILEQKFKRYINKSPFLKNIVSKDVLSFKQPPLSRGLAIGMFCALLPMPFQMVPAFIMCWIAFANIPAAILCVWISNPLTYAPIFYICYQIGHYVDLGNEQAATLTLDDFSQAFMPLISGIFKQETDLFNAGGSAGKLLLDLYITTLQGGVFLGIVLGVIFYFLGHPLSRYIQSYYDKKQAH